MMRNWIEPIIDRTNIDITGRTPKAFLNVVDIERIESNIAYLSTWIGRMGFAVEEVIPSDWNKDGIPKVSDIAVICENIMTLMQAYYEPEGHAEHLDFNFRALHFENVNDIERILLDLYTLLTNAGSNKSLGWAIGIAHSGLYVGC